MDNFTFKVLDWFYRKDLIDDLTWKTRPDGVIEFFVQCNDLFDWATGDEEPLTQNNFELLQKTWKELEERDEDLGYFYSIDAFCCVSRQKWPGKYFLNTVNQHFIDYLKENIK